MLIPTDRIDPHALPRDRSVIDRAAQDELQRSIAASGLRQPVEVFATPEGYALISGYRRLAAVQALHALTGDARWSRIDAVLRAPATLAEALAAMVEENEIRAELSSWERARIAVSAERQGHFATLDAALCGLYPHAHRTKRIRLRAVAEVVEALDGALADPESLAERRLLRIANALRLGWGELIEAALESAEAETAAAQWIALEPVLTEAETLVAEGRPTRPGRPKRLSRPYRSVTIRRERTRNGYLLRITGAGANDTLMTEVLDQIEQMFGAG